MYKLQNVRQIGKLPLIFPSCLNIHTNTKAIISRNDQRMGEYGIDLKEIVALRHSLHSEPELAFQEVRTREKLVNFLKSKGAGEEMFKFQARTGFCCDIRGRAPSSSPTTPMIVGFRSEMDALPIEERNAELPYRSRREEVAHSCGHDGHMAILGGFGEYILRVREQIPEDIVIRLIFQPGEEGAGGAEEMVGDGVLDGVSAIYGGHNWPSLDLGYIALREGPMMSLARLFSVQVLGKATHGAQPYLGRDPISVVCAIQQFLPSILALNLPLSRKSFITVCKIHGGVNHNQIPDTAQIIGNIRCFEKETRDLISHRLEEISHATALLYGCTATVNYLASVPAVVNHPQCYKELLDAAIYVMGNDNCGEKGTPGEASEDFGVYTDHIPGAFMFYGTKEEEGTFQPLHSPSFDFNDNIISSVLEIYKNVCIEKLKLNI